jgi:glycosyltransferase involved in cell wall biosynthesis
VTSNDPHLRTSVVVFGDFFPPAYLGGGPIQTLDALVRSAPENFEVWVVTRNADLGSRDPLGVVEDCWIELSLGLRVRYVSESLRSRMSAIRAVRRIKPEIMYVNSYFSLTYSIVPQLLARFRIIPAQQVLVAPRGEFGGAALGMKSTKKRLFIKLHRLLGLTQQAIWHASSEDEAHRIRESTTARSDVLVRPNETNLPATATPPPNRPPGPLQIIHCARLVPIKGLITLLEALRSVRADVDLHIYGPQEDAEYTADCIQVSSLTPDNVSVVFHQSVSHDEVVKLYKRFDLMAFPTMGENFGHAIAESLSASCPVMCADTTPWSTVLRNGGGKVVSPSDPETWAHAIEEYAALGENTWADNRQAAKIAYGDWYASQAESPHIFSLVRTRMENAHGRGLRPFDGVADARK